MNYLHVLIPPLYLKVIVYVFANLRIKFMEKNDNLHSLQLHFTVLHF